MCEISHHEECFPRDTEEEENLLDYLGYHQRNRTSIIPQDRPTGGPTVTLHKGHHYYYHPNVVQEILSWSCDSGLCDAGTRKCINDPAKGKRKVLKFYEYEAEIDKMKERSAASISFPSSAFSTPFHLFICAYSLS
jgi:hypothetical protein